MPRVLTRRFTLSREPSVARTVLRMFRPTARAHSLPCSVDNSEPTRPCNGVLSLIFAGPWPETYSILPTRTAVLYLAIGFGGGGSVRCNSRRRVSGFDMTCSLQKDEPHSHRKHREENTEKPGTRVETEAPKGACIFYLHLFSVFSVTAGLDWTRGDWTFFPFPPHPHPPPQRGGGEGETTPPPPPTPPHKGGGGGRNNSPHPNPPPQRGEGEGETIPPTPTLPHKGGRGREKPFPPPQPSPTKGGGGGRNNPPYPNPPPQRGRGREKPFPPPQPSPTRGEGALLLPPPLWGRVGVGGEREKLSNLPVPSITRALTRPARQSVFEGVNTPCSPVRVRGAPAMLILRGHTGPVRCLAYSPDGSFLVSGSDDTTVRLWDLKRGRQRRTLIGHSDWVRAVAFASDGKTFASGSWDDTVRMWHVRRTRAYSRFVSATLGGVWSLAFAPDGQLLVGGGNGIVLRYWPDEEAGTRFSKCHPYTIDALAFSPDGGFFATGSHDCTIKLWDTNWGREQAVLTGHRDWVRCLAFSPDGQTLASAGDDCEIRLWDVLRRKTKTLLSGHTASVRQLVFAADGRTLFSASWDETVRLWDVTTGCQRTTYNWQIGRVHCLALAPDGMTAAAGGHDSVIVLWDIA